MKLVKMFHVHWKPSEPNYTTFAGLSKYFSTLQEAFDFIESEESPSDMIPIAVSKDQPIDITYIYTKETEVGHEEHSVTKSLQEWKKSKKLSI